MEGVYGWQISAKVLTLKGLYKQIVSFKSKQDLTVCYLWLCYQYIHKNTEVLFFSIIEGKLQEYQINVIQMYTFKLTKIQVHLKKNLSRE